MAERTTPDPVDADEVGEHGRGYLVGEGEECGLREARGTAWLTSLRRTQYPGPGSHYSLDRSVTHAATWVRDVRPNLVRMFSTCDSAVR